MRDGYRSDVKSKMATLPVPELYWSDAGSIGPVLANNGMFMEEDPDIDETHFNTIGSTLSILSPRSQEPPNGRFSVTPL